MNKSIALLFVIITSPLLVLSQNITALSDIVSESSSRKILPANSIIIETNFEVFNTPQYTLNNTNLSLRYGLFNLFELNGTYTYGFGKSKMTSVNDQENSTSNGGYLNKIGIKIKLYTSKNKNFEMALSGNYFCTASGLALGTPISEPNEIDGTVTSSKIAELSFRNHFSEKCNLNYSVSYNRDGFIECSVGATLRIVKKFYAGVDAYSKIAAGVPYFEGYAYLRTSLNYEITPRLLINASTAGEIGNYYSYSQSGMIGLTWRLK